MVVFWACKYLLTWSLPLVPADLSTAPFPIKAPVTAAVLSELQTAIVAAVTAGERSVLIDLDEVAVLDSALISTLVKILREVRALGGTVKLAVSRKNLLDTLRVTALDKVFAIVEPGAPVPPARPPAASVRRRRVPMAVLIVAGLLGLTGPFGASAAPESDLSATQIVQLVAEQNPEMRSYQARLRVDFQLRSFPYIGQHLEGKTYFKRPDNFEVVFDKVPSYAKGFEKVYSDIDDPTNWAKRFNLAVAGHRIVAGHDDVVLRLTLKIRGRIEHQDVAIDPASWHIDEMQWYYDDGGYISISQDYQHVGSFSLLKTQHATIRIPFAHASAEGRYDDYRTNVAIDDAVFTKGAH
jgi:anti-anti-sigma factor